MKANKTKTSSKRMNTRKPESPSDELNPAPWKHESGAAPSPDDIATAAYYNYLNEGSPQGQSLKHWFDAEAQMGGSRTPIKD